MDQASPESTSGKRTAKGYNQHEREQILREFLQKQLDILRCHYNSLRPDREWAGQGSRRVGNLLGNLNLFHRGSSLFCCFIDLKNIEPCLEIRLF